jgi:hypothetical protein
VRRDRRGTQFLRITPAGNAGRGRSADLEDVFMVYSISMRKAISVTMSADNLLWLRGQAARTGRGSVSEVLDRIVGEARMAGRTEPAAVRSIIGTVDLPDDDPGLEQADAYIRSAFAASLQRPMAVRERSTSSRVKKGRRG